MDLLEALRSFAAVASERSFTRGAERCGQPQPVASRRIAALEQRLGVPLFVRSSRQVHLTEPGEKLLPMARELVLRAEQIDRLFDDAHPSLVIAVPPALTARARAAIRRGLPAHTVVFADSDPLVRIDLQVEEPSSLALVPAAAEEAEIRVELGIAHHDHEPSARFRLGELRRPVRERDRPARKVHLRAEDAVPAIRDPLQAACFRHGLRADQIAVGTGEIEAWTRMYEHGDTVLASADEAAAEGVAWAALDEPSLRRAYRLRGSADLTVDQRTRLLARLASGLGGAVGSGEEPA